MRMILARFSTRIHRLGDIKNQTDNPFISIQYNRAQFLIIQYNRAQFLIIQYNPAQFLIIQYKSRQFDCQTILGWHRVGRVSNHKSGFESN